MSFMVKVWRRFIFSFVGSDIQRFIAELRNDAGTKSATSYSKEVDYVLLAPNQVKALRTMQKYAPKQQVQALFELYEKANLERPVNPITAVQIMKKDILQPQEQKEWNR